MCQQQFEAEIMAEMHQRAFNMSHIVCENTLIAVRQFPGTALGEWYSGRTRCAALIYPTPENLSARNEVEFLIGTYADRHFRGRS